MNRNGNSKTMLEANRSGLPAILGSRRAAGIDIVLHTIELAQDSLNLLIYILHSIGGIVCRMGGLGGVVLLRCRIAVCGATATRVGLLAASCKRERQHKRNGCQQPCRSLTQVSNPGHTFLLTFINSRNIYPRCLSKAAWDWEYAQKKGRLPGQHIPQQAGP